MCSLIYEYCEHDQTNLASGKIKINNIHDVTVARVLPLACANEHLLRTMDSLVAVQ